MEPRVLSPEEGDKILKRLVEEKEKKDWKDIQNKYFGETKNYLEIAALQMRYRRYVDRNRKWTSEEVRTSVLHWLALSYSSLIPLAHTYTAARLRSSCTWQTSTESLGTPLQKKCPQIRRSYQLLLVI